MVKYLEILLVFLAPSLRIPPRWRFLWSQTEIPLFTIGARLYFLFFMVAYLLHFFLVDIPLNKTPISLWAEYRFGCAAIALLGLVITFFRKPMSSTLYSRLPIIFSGLIYGFMQAESMTWRAEIPYFYALILPAVAAIALRTSIASTLFFLITAYALEIRGWQARPNEIPYLTSAAIVTILGVSVFRSRMSAEVSAFISKQQSFEKEKRIIEMELELADQIRAFLPKVIFNRFDHFVKENKYTVIQAIDEVLRGKKANVACLYSDIRDFTSRSKTSNTFVYNSVIPNMRACTDIIEQQNGVPRLIGDLIFAYFDDPHPSENIRRAILSALLISDKNDDLNSLLSINETIVRYIVITSGDAIVGNTGGSQGSREITAIGRPSNLSSRIDSLTKDPIFQKTLSSHRIILSAAVGEYLNQSGAAFDLRTVQLESLNLHIRDFPEESKLFLFPSTDANRRLINDPIPETSYKVAA